MKVLLAREAADDLERVPLTIHVRVLRVFERLRDWPHVSGAKPLRGPLAGHYRMRTGDYRVQFRLERAAVIIEKIGHRDRFYEG
jgi:mRNA-degrading endonuclease RelE of RelBE toxin-antitoxin system